MNIQLSGTEISSKTARLIVKGEQFGSSFRERLRDSCAQELKGIKIFRLNEQQPNETAVHGFTPALGSRERE